MAYSYAAEEPWLNTKAGQQCVLKAWDRLRAVTKQTGAIQVAYALDCAEGVGDSTTRGTRLLVPRARHAGRELATQGVYPMDGGVN